MDRCPNCGKALPEREACQQCGSRLGAGPFCPTCGAEQPGRHFCPHCGEPLAAAPARGGALGVWPGPYGRPIPRWQRWAIGCVGVPLFLLVLAIVLGASGGNLAALIIAGVAAVAPTYVYGRLILSFDKYEIEPRRTILFAFGWGAIGAILFSLIAELLFAGIAIAFVDEDAAGVLTVVVGAPVIEEACKGLALLGLLWFYRHELDNLLDGLVYGALIGLGFAMTENLLYFMQAYLEGGVIELGILFVIRAIVNGLGHAVYTGAFGAAIGWSRARYEPGPARILVPILGFLIGVLLHMAWNGGVLVVDHYFEGIGIALAMIVQSLLVVVPPLIVLYFIARRAGVMELGILREELEPEVARGVLTPDEYRTLTDNRLRKETLRQARQDGGVSRWRLQRQFFSTAGDLAFRLRHIRLDRRITPHDHHEVDHRRQQLAYLRRLLRGSRRS